MSGDPALGEDHEVLGSEYCSGYYDAQEKWNNGFYCPSGDTQALYCCGPPTDKFCCDRREHVNKDDFSGLPLLLGVVTGIIAAISIVTLMSCCFCSCCILYKKRQPTSNGGPLYQLQCSSTTSGVANMYSFSNQNSIASTPIDTAVLVDMEPMTRSVERSYMPRGHHTFSCEPDPAPHPDVLGDSGSRLRTVEPPPPYDSTASYAVRDNLAPHQIKRHHIQLPQPPQHPPPLPPVQQEVLLEQIGGNSSMQNNLYISVQGHSALNTTGTLRQTPTSQVAEPLKSHSVLSDTCTSPEGSQDTTSASESPQSVIKQELSDIPEESFCSSTSVVPATTLLMSSTHLSDSAKQASNDSQSHLLNNSSTQNTGFRGHSQTLMKSSASGPPPPIRSHPPIRSEPPGSVSQSPKLQTQMLGPSLNVSKHPPTSSSAVQPSIPKNATKTTDNNVLYHSTKF